MKKPGPPMHKLWLCSMTRRGASRYNDPPSRSFGAAGEIRMTNESGPRPFGFDHSFILGNSSFVIPFHSVDIRHFALCHSFLPLLQILEKIRCSSFASSQTV